MADQTRPDETVDYSQAIVDRDQATQAQQFPERYRLEGEIARGGMGAVLRGHDAELGREIAVKVMLETHQGRTELLQRFVEEAQIGGQLQHPGIVPIYDIGRSKDKRPYFTMKLIKGRTLAAMLKERSDTRLACHDVATGEPPVVTDLPRFLAIYEQICQTLAYAHSRSVIHRDLKPANIMVGNFGEVQVMDWGLAKVVSGQSSVVSGSEKTGLAAIEKPVASQASAAPSGEPGTTDDGPRTRTGTVLGTPAYMPPEQAKGEVDELDERCDVFGLGAILCVILTGKPPYVGKNTSEVHQMAMAGDLGDASNRLDQCGADAELIELTKRCLHAKKEARPRDAGEVAEAVTAYLESVQQRLKQAEIATAQAKTKVQEERKRRKVQLALAASVLLLVSGVSGAAIWYQQDRMVRDAKEAQLQAEKIRRHALEEQRFEAALNQARQFRSQLIDDLMVEGGVFKLLNNPAEWQRRIEAVSAALKRAEAIQAGAEDSFDAEPQQQMNRLALDLKQDKADRALAMNLEKIREAKTAVKKRKYKVAAFEFAIVLKKYPAVFHNAGLDVTAGKEGQIAERIRKSAIREQLIAALDDWAIELKRDSNQDDLMQRVLFVSHLADRDSVLAELRQRNTWMSQVAVEKLAASLLVNRKALTSMSPQTFTVIGYLLNRTNPLCERWQREAQRLHPDDFWLNFEIAFLLEQKKRWSESAGFYRAAIAVRKKSSAAWNNLGFVLDELGKSDAAVSAYQKAIQFDPEIETYWHNLGLLRYERREWKKAVDAYKEGIRIDDTNYPAWNGLGNALVELELFGEAETAFRTALKLNREYGPAKNGLAMVLIKKGKLNEALTVLHEALRLVSPDERSPVWSNIGLIRFKQNRLKEAAAALQTAIQLNVNNQPAWSNLGLVRLAEKKLDQAVDAFNKATAIDENAVDTWRNLAFAYLQQDKFEEAAFACKKAHELNRNALKTVKFYSSIYTNWAVSLGEDGQYDEAISRCEKAIDIHPSNALAHAIWGECLSKKKEWEAAIAKYREALTLQPRFAQARVSWGQTLFEMKKYDESLSQLTTALEINKDLFDAHATLASVFIMKKSFDKAIIHCKRAFEIDPKHRNAHVTQDYWGVALSMKGKIHEAIAHFKKAIALNPDYLMAHYNYGHALFVHGRFEEAADALKTALRKDPKEPGSHLHLGAALGSLQLWKEVHEATNKALVVVPLSHPEYSVLLERKNHTEKIFALEKMEKPMPISLKTAADGIRGNLTKDCPKDVPFEETARSYRQAYSVRLNAGKSYLIDLKGSFDTYLRIEDDRFRNILFNDDVHTSNLNSRLVITPAKEGTYKLIVTSYSPGATGSFTLTIRNAVSAEKAKTIKAPLKNEPGTVDGKNVGFHRVKLKAGNIYVFETMSRHFAPRLLLAQGRGQGVLAKNDGITPATTGVTRIDFTPAQSGTYTLVVGGRQPGNTGDYTLRVLAYRPKTESPSRD